MTTIPKPAALTSGYTGTYDAWNRLVKIKAGSDTVAEYEYDGFNRRIIKSVYSGGALDHRQHSYYNEVWQELEVRKETSGTEDPDPLDQFVWHPYYVDALATRFYDEDVNGSGIVQHYFTHDANFNIAAAVNSSGAVVERYGYSAYGQLTVLDPSFAAVMGNASAIGNSYTYTGRKLDTETGLYHYRNRQYHAQLGNFVTRDPIGQIGRIDTETLPDSFGSTRYVSRLDIASADNNSEMNLYEYVGSTPTMKEDPSGLAYSPIQCGNRQLHPSGPFACCNGRQYRKATQCCENKRIVNTIQITVCRGALMGDDSGIPIWGDLSHSYIICPNGRQFGFHPRPFDHRGLPYCGPGFVNEEEKRDPKKAKCKKKRVCPSDHARMCPDVGVPVTDNYYGMIGCFSTNCHEWANCNGR